MKEIERLIERTVLASRWLLVLFYIGLAVSLGIYAISFALKLVRLAGDMPGLGEGDMILRMLGLIDAALVASLVVTVMLAGYDNFVSRFENGREDLAWIGKVSAGTLKMKVASAIVAISSIHLLQVFLNVGSYTPMQVWQLTAIHIAFVISALVLGLLDKMTTETKAERAAAKADAAE